MFHDLSPGSAFWLPHGARIYNKLIGFIKEHYWKRGYDEIITPNIFNLDLWHKSGHALHYKDGVHAAGHLPIRDVQILEAHIRPRNQVNHDVISSFKIEQCCAHVSATEQHNFAPHTERKS